MKKRTERGQGNAPKTKRGTGRPSLAGKVAVITGATRGIGLAIARALAAEGCNLVLTGRDKKKLAAAAKELEARGVEVLAAACDVRDLEQVEALFAAAGRRFGRIDVLVNNAGTSQPLLEADRIPVSLWQEVIDTNLTGTFLCTRAALSWMKKGSTIVNNISIAGTQAFPSFSAYCASKYGALGFTEGLRLDVRPRGIRVIALLPGAVDTDIWKQFMPDAPRENMVSAESIATAVVNAILLPVNATVERLMITPTTGEI